MDPAVAMTIEELRRLNIAGLKQRYLTLFGAESKSSNKAFLFRRIAWKIQAQVEGGLSERALQRAAEIADEADLRVRAPRKASFRWLPPLPVGRPTVPRLRETGGFRPLAQSLHDAMEIARLWRKCSKRASSSNPGVIDPSVRSRAKLQGRGGTGFCSSV